jgi:hypothetical protein
MFPTVTELVIAEEIELSRDGVAVVVAVETHG